MKKDMHRMLRSLYCSIAVLLFFGGCDPATVPSSMGEALWTLQGRIATSEDFHLTGDLRAGVLWINDFEFDSTVASQDVPISATLPASFTLDLFAPPPEEALMDLELYEPEYGVSGRVAMGYVFIYFDGDGDGHFSFTSSEASEFVDVIVGLSDSDAGEYQIWYVDTETPWAFEDDFILDPGLHVISWENGPSTAPGDVSIQIELCDDRSLQALGCEGPLGGWNYSEIPPVAPLEELPAEVVRFNCMADGSIMEWVESCPGVSRLGVCTPVDDSCSVYQTGIPYDEEPPANWPCHIFEY